MTTPPNLPKGAMIKTAKLLRLIFIVAAILVVQSLLQAFRDSGWIFWGRLTFAAIFTVIAVVAFRSWRIAERSEAEQ